MRDVNILKNNGVDVEKGLEYLGDMDTYNEIIDVFLKEIKTKVQELKNSKESGNISDYAIYAHSIKSDARTLGFTKLGELALEHEMHSKENDENFISLHYDELMNEIDKTIKIVSLYVGI